MAQNHSYSHDHPNILTAANSMSATLASSVAAHHNTFVPLTLGRSANAIELLVPIAPAVHNATDLKACAFDFLSDLLCQHAEQYSSAELIAACNHIPGTSYNANQEATTICSSLRAAFFTTTNLTNLGFRDNRGCPITSLITVDPATRSPGIAYFVFHSTIDPATVDPASRELVSLLSFGLPYLKPSSLRSLPLIMPFAIFSRISTAPLPPFPQLLQPFSSVKPIWTLFQPMSLLSLVPKPAVTLFLRMLSTVIICSPLSSLFSSANPPLPPSPPLLPPLALALSCPFVAMYDSCPCIY